MKKTTKVTTSSVLYRKIDELGLTGSKRLEAIGALQAVDRITDSISWASEKLALLKRGFTPNPKLKHQ